MRSHASATVSAALSHLRGPSKWRSSTTGVTVAQQRDGRTHLSTSRPHGRASRVSSVAWHSSHWPSKSLRVLGAPSGVQSQGSSTREASTGSSWRGNATATPISRPSACLLPAKGRGRSARCGRVVAAPSGVCPETHSGIGSAHSARSAPRRASVSLRVEVRPRRLPESANTTRHGSKTDPGASLRGGSGVPYPCQRPGPGRKLTGVPPGKRFSNSALRRALLRPVAPLSAAWSSA